MNGMIYTVGQFWASLALAGVITLLAPLGALAADEVATPVSHLVSPNGKHLAYGQIAVGPGGEQKVRIIVGDVAGTNRRPLPIDAESVDEVQWYGNDRIAYVTKHGEDGYHLIDLDGQPAGELRMPPGCDSFFHQCLSPDGKSIAYCGSYIEVDRPFASDQERRQYLEDHPDIKPTHGLYLVDLATQSVQQVLTETVANLPSWSPDSRLLACGIGHYEKDYPLVIVERESGKVHRPDVQGTACGWSADSQHLAIVTDIVQGGSWLGGTPLDGAIGALDVAKFVETGDVQVVRVSESPVNVSAKEPYAWSLSGSYGAIWSPDGQWLAYRHRETSRSESSEPTFRESVWLVQSDGSGARKVLNHGATELAWADQRTLLWVDQGQLGRLDIELDGTATLGPTPVATNNAFVVTGRVTDSQGQPLQDVEVRAATGIGSLRTGQPVKTDLAGRYELHFGPGMMSMDGGPNLQAATIYAHKSGWYERDQCQHGNLGMANYRPKDFDDGDWHFEAVVYRGQPYKLDFVMLPAAQVKVELVDPRGEPLVDYALELDGDELYPSSSILESTKTDSTGQATFDDVPLRTFWFSLGRRDEIRTAPVEFSEAGEAGYRLIYDDIAGTLTAERH